MPLNQISLDQEQGELLEWIKLNTSLKERIPFLPGRQIGKSVWWIKRDCFFSICFQKARNAIKDNGRYVPPKVQQEIFHSHMKKPLFIFRNGQQISNILINSRQNFHLIGWHTTFHLAVTNFLELMSPNQAKFLTHLNKCHRPWVNMQRIKELTRDNPTHNRKKITLSWR